MVDLTTKTKQQWDYMISDTVLTESELQSIMTHMLSLLRSDTLTADDIRNLISIHDAAMVRKERTSTRTRSY